MESTPVSWAQVNSLVQDALQRQERRLTEVFEARIKAVEAQWESRLADALAPKARDTAKAETERKRKAASKEPCFCCGGVSAVHRHRELGVRLDDKCRKQVETFRQGGIITERRPAWARALRHIGANRLAQQMLLFLEGSPNELSNCCATKKMRKMDTKDSSAMVCTECAICKDTFIEGQGGACSSSTLDLPCAHTFHRKCIVPWLQENPHCPLCRTDVRLEYPSADLADVRVVATKPCEVGTATGLKQPCTEGLASELVGQSCEDMFGSTGTQSLALTNTQSDDWLLHEYGVELSEIAQLPNPPLANSLCCVPTTTVCTSRAEDAGRQLDMGSTEPNNGCCSKRKRAPEVVEADKLDDDWLYKSLMNGEC